MVKIRQTDVCYNAIVYLQINQPASLDGPLEKALTSMYSATITDI